MRCRPFVSKHRRLVFVGVTAAITAGLALGAAPAHARPIPPAEEAPAVQEPPASQPPEETAGGPAAGENVRPPAETVPELELVADPDNPLNKESPFDVILEVEIPDHSEPVVVAHIDLVQLQGAVPGREATSLTVKWSDGSERAFDLTQQGSSSIDVRHEYERPSEDRTYTVIAWVYDNEGGVGIDWQDVTIEALYDVTLRPISFSPWGAGSYDCDPWPLQGDGDFTFWYRIEWPRIHLDQEVRFKLGSGDTKTLLPEGLTAVDVTTSDFARMRWGWEERDVGNPFGLGFDTSAPGPKYIDFQPRPDESPHHVDLTDEWDGCEVHITYELVTEPSA